MFFAREELGFFTGCCCLGVMSEESGDRFLGLRRRKAGGKGGDHFGSRR